MNSVANSRNSFGMPPSSEMDQIVSLCKVLATCPYYQKLGAGGVLAIYLTAREMNLPLMMCLNGGMFTFSGSVSLSAQLMNMMVINAGHRADVLHLDEKSCRIKFWRADRPTDNCTFEYEFTLEMASKAGYLNKENWKKHPRDMLYSRCLSGGARKFMPDVLMNAYVIGELGEEDASITPAVPLLTFSDKDVTAEILTPEEVNEIESNILPEDAEYRNNLLNYFTTHLQLKDPMQDFTNLPRSQFKKCMQSILNRKEQSLKKRDEPPKPEVTDSEESSDFA